MKFGLAAAMRWMSIFLRLICLPDFVEFVEMICVGFLFLGSGYRVCDSLSWILIFEMSKSFRPLTESSKR